MDQVFLLKKKIFYTKLYFVKKTDREEMEVEGERAKKTRKCHKISVIKTKTRWYKTYVKKEMMAIEKIENTEAASKSPSKKGNPGVKTSQKEHHMRLERRSRRILQRRDPEARNWILTKLKF